MHTAFGDGLASVGHSWSDWGGSGWGGFGWPWALLWLVFAVLFWGGLIALLIWAVRSSAESHRAPDRAREILQRRLAAGEISEEEYERIQRILQD
ncbi:MAG: SHOCT domain-containing protein [Ktedonobacterales bacterium]